jgi:hypothetical protein
VPIAPCPGLPCEVAVQLDVGLLPFTTQAKNVPSLRAAKA